MDFRQLEAFVSVASLRSFRSAADQLNLTQPAISSRISALEGELGEALFIRTRHPVHLTEKAMEILPYAEQILNISQTIAPRGVMLAPNVGAILRIGTNSSLVSAWLPEMIWKIHKALPNVSFEFEVNSSHRLRERIMRGELDLTLMDMPPEVSGIKSIPLATFDAVWVARPGVVENRKFDLAQVKNTMIVTFKSESKVFSTIETGLRNAGLWPTPMLTSISSALITEMLRRMPAIGTVMRRSIEYELKNGLLEIIDVPIPLPKSNLAVCYPQAHRNEVLRTAVDILKNSVTNSL